LHHYDNHWLASDFRSGALPLPFSGHSISFARLPVLLFSGNLPVFPRENAFSNNFQKNAILEKSRKILVKIWSKFSKILGKSAKICKICKICKILQIFANFVKISEIFSDF